MLTVRYAEGHTNLGNALLVEASADEAIVHYTESLRLMPDGVEAHSNLGVALASLGRFEKSCDHFRRAVEIQPDRYAVYENLASALAEMGRYNDAAGALRTAIKIAKDHGSDDRLQRLESLLREYEPASQSRRNAPAKDR